MYAVSENVIVINIILLFWQYYLKAYIMNLK